MTLLIRHLVELHDLIFPVGLKGKFLFWSQWVQTLLYQGSIGVSERCKPLTFERLWRKSNLSKYTGLGPRDHFIVEIIHDKANFTLSDRFCIAQIRLLIEVLGA